MPDLVSTVAMPALQGGRILFTQDLSGCLGNAPGLDEASLAAAVSAVEDILAKLRQSLAAGNLAQLAGGDPATTPDAAPMAYARLAAGARTLVFLGTGDETLPAQMLAQFGGWSIPGVTALNGHLGPMTRFYDSLDPFTVGSALGRLDLARTRFIVISRSGRDAGTLAQAAAAIQAARNAGLAADLPNLFLGITDLSQPGTGREGGLAAMLSNLGIELLDHGAGLPGRFAVFHNAALVAAVARGADTARLLSGARALIDRFDEPGAGRDFPPLVGAVLAVELARRGVTGGQTLVTDADRLGRLPPWWHGLWRDMAGGLGASPSSGRIADLAARPHANVAAHYTTVVAVEPGAVGPSLASDLAASAGMPELAGRTLGTVAAGRRQAAIAALIRSGNPVRRVHIPALDEETMGALVMHTMLEAILAGWLSGTDPLAAELA
jgi:glucose-6-phosphate isomerase